MTAQEVFNLVKKEWDSYDPEADRDEWYQMPERGQRDFLDKASWGYYQFLTCTMRSLRPKRVVELGGAMGVGCVAMLIGLPPTSKLFSITLRENGLEFSFIKKSYPELTKVIGNDLDLYSWPKEIRDKLGETDILFIDTLHQARQLTRELDIYFPLLKKGAIILLDDIKMNDMFNVWEKIANDKYDASLLHPESGFGIVVKNLDYCWVKKRERNE